MNRSDCLRDAGSMICGPRHDDYGDARENFTRIAEYWSIRLGMTIDAVQVADCLALMKMARKQANPSHADSAVDLCGYIALSIEIATNDSAPQRQKMQRPVLVDPGELPVEPKTNLHPCRSPYCECDVGKCTHPGFYDARHIPAPVEQAIGTGVD